MGLEFLNNPVIKNVATKQLRKNLAESGTQMIAVVLSPGGELDFIEYKEPVTVMRNADLDEIKRIMHDYSATIENLKTQLHGNKD